MVVGSLARAVLPWWAAGTWLPMKVRAVHFVAPRRVELREVEIPEPSDGQLLVATEWSGISAGTELLAYRGEVDPDLPLDETLGALGGTFAYPFRYGYSAVGRVVAPAGPFREGQRVFAFHPHQDRFVADPATPWPVDDLDPRAATLYPTVETALQVTLDATPRMGETVVVVGLGAVGILVAALLARTGAVVVGSEPDPARRAAAGAFGVRAVDPASWPRRWAPGPGGRGADLVVEASGNPEALAGRWDCWPGRGRSWSAPGTAPSPSPCPWGRPSTAAAWPCAAPRCPPSRRP
jgi:2-desacetyl-2-hydroxyethyl bacteriochlorophyllide A dehydrogenase